MAVEPNRADPSDSQLAEAIAARILATGPIGFDEFMHHALYAPGHGFYQRRRGAGRRRDFITSSEVGPLFGAVLAGALDRWWEELGSPSELVVVEGGAGPGTLARSILAARPRCGGALRMVLVEVGEAQRGEHPQGVESRVGMPRPDEVAGRPVVVLANELLDNLPFGLVELTDAGWMEVVVDAGPSSGLDPSDRHGPRFVEAHRRLSPVQQRWCQERAGADAAVGARMPVHSEGAAWVVDAVDLVSGGPGGRVVVFDYFSTSAQLARRPWTEWVRTYAVHGRPGSVLDVPGSRDITGEVPWDQLRVSGPEFVRMTQARFLGLHGIDELVAEGRRRWEDEGLDGGLGAIAGRSRVTEASALCDPAGLGAFEVLQWIVSPRPGAA